MKVNITSINVPFYFTLYHLIYGQLEEYIQTSWVSVFLMSPVNIVLC